MKSRRKQKNKGFSLIEFVVILTIFSIMTSISLFSYNQHKSSVQESNIAQDVALTIRQAQVYGISASNKTIGSQNFDASADTFFTDTVTDITRDKSIRGVSIDLTQGSIIIFEDNGGTKYAYNVGPDRIIDKRKIISRSVKMKYVQWCTSASSCSEKKTTGNFDITFKRPYPDALFAFGGNRIPNVNYAVIVLAEDSGLEKNHYVEINAIGNISVKKNHGL